MRDQLWELQGLQLERANANANAKPGDAAGTPLRGPVAEASQPPAAPTTATPDTAAGPVAEAADPPPAQPPPPHISLAGASSLGRDGADQLPGADSLSRPLSRLSHSLMQLPGRLAREGATIMMETLQGPADPAALAAQVRTEGQRWGGGAAGVVWWYSRA